MQYKRVKLAGQSYFFTVNLEDRSTQLLTDNIELLRNAVRGVKRKHPFTIDAMVVLPEHLHCIWTMPQNDHDYSMRWGLIKSDFSRGIPRQEFINSARAAKRERSIWQHRFWEHCIRNESDMNDHINYIHINPVKHGYTNKASDWAYSSIHRYIRKGILSADWACDVDDLDCGY